MTDTERPAGGDDSDRADAHLVAERAHLLPEELAAGSDDPEAQAEQILAESERRTLEPEATQAEYSQTDESTSEDRAAGRSA